MLLQDWLYKKKITKRRLARDIGIHEQSAFRIITRKHTPTLFTSLAIEKYTSGEVTLVDILSEKDAEKYVKIDTTPCNTSACKEDMYIL